MEVALSKWWNDSNRVGSAGWGQRETHLDFNFAILQQHFWRCSFTPCHGIPTSFQAWPPLFRRGWRVFRSINDARLQSVLPASRSGKHHCRLRAFLQGALSHQCGKGWVCSAFYIFLIHCALSPHWVIFHSEGGNGSGINRYQVQSRYVQVPGAGTGVFSMAGQWRAWVSLCHWAADVSSFAATWGAWWCLVESSDVQGCTQVGLCSLCHVLSRPPVAVWLRLNAVDGRIDCADGSDEICPQRRLREFEGWWSEWSVTFAESVFRLICTMLC